MATGRDVLPIELQVGDRITDEAGEWEVIAPAGTPRQAAGSPTRAQPIDQPASWEIRSWDALKQISVKRGNQEAGEEGAR